jgi:MinD superfamily P-loop ATPase
MPGVTVQVTERCAGCGACTQDVCFVDAIQLLDGRAVRTEGCRACGRCVEVCPEGAIEVVVEDGGSVQEVIERISALVDVS